MAQTKKAWNQLPPDEQQRKLAEVRSQLVEDDLELLKLIYLGGFDDVHSYPNSHKVIGRLAILGLVESPRRPTITSIGEAYVGEYGV